MSIPVNNVDPRVQYTASAGQTVFSFPFLIFEESHLFVEKIATDGVTITTLVNPTEYTVNSGSVNNPTGGNITLVVSAAAGEIYTLYRDVTEERTSDFIEGGDFSANALNEDLDLLVMMIQELISSNNRTVRLKQSDTSTEVELPIASARASKFLGFDASGNAIAATTITTAVVSTFAETLLDDTNATSMLNTLGFSAFIQTLIDDADAATALNTLTALGRAQYPFVRNFSFDVTESGGDLTVDFETLAEVNADADNPISFGFRDATLTKNVIDIVNLTGALAVTIVSGASLGFTDAEDGYIYLYACNNAGTIVGGVTKKALFDEGVLHSTTLLDASSDSDDVLYTTSALTNVAIKLVGRMRVARGTATWDTVPTEEVLWFPGMKKTGDIIQRVRTLDSAVASGTGIITIDDSIPQNTEGDEYMTRTITPTSSINPIEVEIYGNFSQSGGAQMVMALFLDTDADADAAITNDFAAAANPEQVSLFHAYESGLTAAAHTLKMRAGNSAAGTLTFNGESAARTMGGVMASRMIVTEIQA